MFTMKHLIHTALLGSTLLGSALLSAPAFADEAAQMALGKKLFATATPACALCHTLKDAGAEGAIGPVLDELKPDAARVARALRDGIGAMPSFKATLSEADIAALSLYVSKASAKK
ncbi:sulfide dehydrogenase [Delftia sp. HK171]|jgi:sulfite dehydrogenase|uniref:SorU family sulfite dehydrogenase c-type cytochrome subunit n=1 Tax=Delftia TaxID=80865 RepID=UPI0004D4BA23|nr:MULTISPECIES: cytochrome c [Delftia]KEH11359.1 sulfide dehydrogenase [Delftia sp. 670]APE46841.1 sulfide dehydrogenase [Delftia sp. HK171]KZK30624.1 sulfide dehydrogenase [Delftia sp. GW456-R20]OBY87426.1 sulfide dehydrogenase [Delftia sp. JD2]TDF29313.1 cytochrome c [Delftia tsuruhatensis]